MSENQRFPIVSRRRKLTFKERISHWIHDRTWPGYTNDLKLHQESDGEEWTETGFSAGVDPRPLRYARVDGEWKQVDPTESVGREPNPNWIDSDAPNLFQYLDR